MRRPRVGISACLLGRRVRYDGGHRAAPDLLAALPADFQLIPLCPETEAGLGTPRPPVRLVRTSRGIRALGVNDPGLDVTAPLEAHALARVETLRDLHGCILKRNSPSCGIRGVPVYPESGGEPSRRGTGLFAALLRERLPGLVLADEADLADPERLRVFVGRVRTRLEDERKGP